MARYDPTVGYAMIERFLDRTEVEAVLAECDRLFNLAPEQRHHRDKFSHGTRHLEDLSARSEVIAEIVERVELLDVVAAIVGPNPTPQVMSYRCPQPGFGGQKLHADDVPKLDDAPELAATAIVALVDFASDNGSTRFVPGSHRRPDLQRSAGSLESHPDEQVFLGEAGTAFVYSGHLLHAGGENRSSADRPALQLTWRRQA